MAGSSAPLRFGMVVGGWLALALMQAAMLASVAGSARRAGELLALHVALGLTWALMTPFVAAATRGRRWIPAAFARHVFVLLAAAFVDTMARRAMVSALGGAAVLPWYGTMLYFADRTFASYLLIVVVARTLEAHDQFIMQQRQALALQAQLAHARLASLEQQLHPHFLFNTLGAVTELAYEAPARAARMLRQLASVLSFALERRAAEVTLGEEVAALEPYLEVQRTRFADWLTIGCEIESSAGSLLLPPLVLQPLVENSIRHGLSQRVAAGQILIRARGVDDKLVIEVRDNGVGLSQERPLDGRGIGLSSVRERLAALYGDDAGLILFHDDGGETVARLTIPARRAEAAAPASSRMAPSSDAHFQMPEVVRRHPAVGVLIAWTAWGFLWTQQSIAYLAFRDRLGERGLLDIVASDFMTSMLWAALTPLMLLVLKLVPLVRPKVGLRLALHGAAAVGIAIVHGALAAVLVHRTPIAVRTPEGIASIIWGVFAYIIVVTIAHHRTISEWLRERELSAARLRVSLAEAELGAATARRRPRELLGRLEAIAVTVGRNPAEAEHDLMLLGDQLRADLDARVPA